MLRVSYFATEVDRTIDIDADSFLPFEFGAVRFYKDDELVAVVFGVQYVVKTENPSVDFAEFVKGEPRFYGCRMPLVKEAARVEE